MWFRGNRDLLSTYNSIRVTDTSIEKLWFWCYRCFSLFRKLISHFVSFNAYPFIFNLFIEQFKYDLKIFIKAIIIKLKLLLIHTNTCIGFVVNDVKLFKIPTGGVGKGFRLITDTQFISLSYSSGPNAKL